jgi:Skp family chaperone for outer membrane proteins
MLKRFIGLSLIVASVMFANSSQADEAGLKVAVVRIQDAFSDYERAKEMKADIEKTFTPDKNAVKKLQAQISKMKQDLRADSMTEPGSFKHYEKLQAIRTKEYLLKTMREELSKELNERMTDFYKVVYADFQKAVKEYALKNGYDLVVRKADENLTNNSAMGVQNEIGLKILHYVAPSLDRTKQIVQIMNRNWRKAKASRRGR